MKEWRNVGMESWMAGLDGCLAGWMAGWLDGWMAGWLAGWMDGWMDEAMNDCYELMEWDGMEWKERKNE